MRIVGRAIAAVALLVFVAAVARLDTLQMGDPPHLQLMLPNDLPATLYLPGTGHPFYNPVTPRSSGPRPPGVVLLHGFAADRSMMSVLARRLANNGFAVCAIDFRGHGGNRNPFRAEFVGNESLYPDVKEAVDFMRSTPYVDGSKLAIVGHSMGAEAALDYVSHDPNVIGSVLISGGWSLDGPERPRNTLFIFASGDPGIVRRNSPAIAAQLAGVDRVELGRSYGEQAAGTGVKALEVEDVNHVTILFSAGAAREIIGWLDGVFGMPPRADPDLSAPSFSTAAIAFAAFCVMLMLLGEALGKIAPSRERRPADAGSLLGLGMLAAGLVLAMPLAAPPPPADFLCLELAGVAFSWLGIAGGALLAVLVIGRNLNGLRLFEQPMQTLLAAFLGIGAIYVLMAPFGPVFHRLALTPERLIASVLATLVLAPFFIAFEVLVRRGRPGIATLLAMLGRMLIVAILAGGILTGVMPAGVTLMLPILGGLFVLFEILAASIYQACGNIVAIALVEAAWLALIAAATLPIRIML